MYSSCYMKLVSPLFVAWFGVAALGTQTKHPQDFTGVWVNRYRGLKELPLGVPVRSSVRHVHDAATELVRHMMLDQRASDFRRWLSLYPKRKKSPKQTLNSYRLVKSISIPNNKGKMISWFRLSSTSLSNDYSAPESEYKSVPGCARLGP